MADCSVEATLEGARRALAEAEGALPHLPGLMREQAIVQADAVRASVAWLTDTSHNVVFVGPVGIGKSLAVSNLTGLVLPDAAEPSRALYGGSRISVLDRRAVLSASSGRTTACPVSIRHGEATRVVIEPLPDTEVTAYVADLAHEVWLESRDEAPSDVSGLVPEETGRALRNMMDLRKHEIADLASKADDEPSFLAALTERMDLGSRTTLTLEPAVGESHATWLKGALSDVNSGRRAGVPLPARIRVTTPLCAVCDGLDLTFVDTKGGDHGHVHSDLRDALDSDRDLVVVCSSFAGLPDESSRAVLRHAKEVSGTAGSGRIALLALARPGEAENAREESGDHVDDALSGVRMKIDEARRIVRRIVPGDKVALGAYDAGRDPPGPALETLAERLRLLRSERARSLETLVEGLRELVSARTLDQVRSVTPLLRAVAEAAASHSDPDLALPGLAGTSPLASEVRRYAATIWASSRRRGTYENLDVHQEMATHYATAVLAKATGTIKDLRFVLSTWLEGDDALSRAVAQRLDAEFSDIPRKASREARNAVATLLASTLGHDEGLWSRCAGAWGHAELRDERPYIAYVRNNVGDWLDDAPAVERTIRDTVSKAWRDAVAVPLAKAGQGEGIEIGAPTPALAFPDAAKGGAVPMPDFLRQMLGVGTDPEMAKPAAAGVGSGIASPPVSAQAPTPPRNRDAQDPFVGASKALYLEPAPPSDLPDCPETALAHSVFSFIQAASTVAAAAESAPWATGLAEMRGILAALRRLPPPPPEGYPEPVRQVSAMGREIGVNWVPATVPTAWITFAQQESDGSAPVVTTACWRLAEQGYMWLANLRKVDPVTGWHDHDREMWEELMPLFHDLGASAYAKALAGAATRAVSNLPVEVAQASVPALPRIPGPPSMTVDVEFSVDGRKLAATLSRQGGLLLPKQPFKAEIDGVDFAFEVSGEVGVSNTRNALKVLAMRHRKTSHEGLKAKEAEIASQIREAGRATLDRMALALGARRALAYASARGPAAARAEGVLRHAAALAAAGREVAAELSRIGKAAPEPAAAGRIRR